MRVFRLLGTASLFLLMALPAIGQTTGASVMTSLAETLRRELTEYRIVAGVDVIQVLDKENDTEVLSIREAGPSNVSITATLGTYAGVPRETLERIRERIALFNYSSAVGTMSLDDRSGTVAMSHNLNPGYVPVAQMVHVASLCGDVAREQARTLGMQ